MIQELTGLACRVCASANVCSDQRDTKGSTEKQHTSNYEYIWPGLAKEPALVPNHAAIGMPASHYSTCFSLTIPCR